MSPFGCPSAPASAPPPSPFIRFAPRGRWSSQFGFLCACAGSAVGLGNIWKFPYIAGENGGGLFVLIYVLSIMFLGIPIMVGEFAMGRASQASAASAFGMLSTPRGPWRFAGWFQVATTLGILSFYSVAAGWALHYVLLSVTNFAGDADAFAVGAHFQRVYESGALNVFWSGVFLAITGAVVFSGVREGIEKASIILMPALFGVLCILFLRVTSLPGFTEAFSFVFLPHFELMSAGGVMEAVGHAFFTLSLGQGIMITYGSYLPRDTDIVGSAIAVSVMDTFVALLSCLIVFPVVFSYGMDPESGPGLIFETMPMLFQRMPGGWIFSFLFFNLLAFAALSSAISLLEVLVSSLIDVMEWDRKKATIVAAASVFALAIPSALSGGVLWDWIVVDNRNFFESMDYLSTNWALPIGGLITALFVGFRMDPNVVRKEFGEDSPFTSLFVPWMNCVRFICPVAVAAVFLYSIRSI
ncbi:MAG: sodium-dependent transporter [Elusimicrobia bacterium]|nr:MAG: sodium-dependent transporter [Elusimicrobiota bacterium]